MLKNVLWRVRPRAKVARATFCSASTSRSSTVAPGPWTSIPIHAIANDEKADTEIKRSFTKYGNAQWNVNWEACRYLKGALASNFEVRLLGEGSTGSMAIRPRGKVKPNDGWLPVQVWASKGPVKRTNQRISTPDVYNFSMSGSRARTAENQNMPLLCFDHERMFLWFMTAKKSKRQIRIGRSYDVEFRHSLNPKDEAFIGKHLKQFYDSGECPTATFEELNRPRGKTCLIEHESTLIGNRILEACGVKWKDPREWYSVVDRVLKFNHHGQSHEIRVQEKTSNFQFTDGVQHPSFAMNFGKSVHGVKVPYDVADFDVLMVSFPTRHDNRQTKLFMIPINALYEHNCVSGPTKSGSRYMSLLEDKSLKKCKYRQLSSDWTTSYVIDITNIPSARKKVRELLRGVIDWRRSNPNINWRDVPDVSMNCALHDERNQFSHPVSCKPIPLPTAKPGTTVTKAFSVVKGLINVLWKPP